MWKPNNTSLCKQQYSRFLFSLEQGSSLHKSQRPTDLKPKVSSLYPTSVSSKKPKSLTCVSTCIISQNEAKSFQHQFAKIYLTGL